MYRMYLLHTTLCRKQNVHAGQILSFKFGSERELHVRYLLSPVRLSVCLSSVTFVRPTQTVQIFGNISTALGTLAIR